MISEGESAVKEGMIAMHGQATDKAVADADLRRCGVKVTQEESFFVEPDLTKIMKDEG